MSTQTKTKNMLYKSNGIIKLKEEYFNYVRRQKEDVFDTFEGVEYVIAKNSGDLESIIEEFDDDWPIVTTLVDDMTNLFNSFYRRDRTSRVGISTWDVSNVKNMSSMFFEATSFNQPLNNWDVSNVKNMDGMFYEATSFNQPLNNWDVSNVKNMSFMFNRATFFNQPLNNWNVSSVEDMTFMFAGAASFNQPLNNWNVSNVKNMYGMFYGATSFNQPLNNWNVSNVRNMSNMFDEATSFNQPLNDWDVRNITYMEGMFNGATLFNQNQRATLIAFGILQQPAPQPPKCMSESQFNNCKKTDDGDIEDPISGEILTDRKNAVRTSSGTPYDCYERGSIRAMVNHGDKRDPITRERITDEWIAENLGEGDCVDQAGGKKKIQMNKYYKQIDRGLSLNQVIKNLYKEFM